VNIQGSLGETLKEVRPTLFLTVPRIWEKMQEAIEDKLKQTGSPMKNHIIKWAKKKSLKSHVASMKGYARNVRYYIPHLGIALL
jgi:long-subunit acyl-CoA synthetase (AMP-forming)